MKFLNKYYQFTILVLLLSAMAFHFGESKDIVLIIVGALVGALSPKEKGE